MPRSILDGPNGFNRAAAAATERPPGKDPAALRILTRGYGNQQDGGGTSP